MLQTETIRCPLCNDAVEKLLYRFHLENERLVIGKIREMNPGWSEGDGACSRCRDYYQVEVLLERRAIPGIGPHFPVRSADDFIILPTALRLDADPRFNGNGITICFIDSGFYPHPDLTVNKNRVKACIDITGNNANGYAPGDVASWHGTMTSVVCAGDGHLSDGLYKGIASDASLVLLKVMDEDGQIKNEAIIKALKWILRHYREYNIRVVNISIGADDDKTTELEINALVEALADKNIAVVAAVGNNENATVRAPANSLNSITIGGVDDENKPANQDERSYHSAYAMIDGHIVKPELIAPAVWIAAPLLPGSPEERESSLLHELLNVSEQDLFLAVSRLDQTQLPANSVVHTGDIGRLKGMMLDQVRQKKFISPHYMHVDGTSFATAIVTAVIAQLLEIDPSLTLADIRSVLFSTASRIAGLPAGRQGFGRINPRKAVQKVLRRQQAENQKKSPVIDDSRNTISFWVQHENASQVSLVGSFNHWEKDVLLLEAGKGGSWWIEIPMLPAGRYAYKFYVDGITWLEDVNNPFREPDGFRGFNSILTIKN